MAVTNHESSEQEIEALFSSSFQNLMKLWDGEPILHAYHFNGDINDDHYAAAHRTSEVLAEAAQIDTESQLLDIGCGCGSFLFHVAKQFRCSCVGIDLCEEHIKFAREKLTNENIEFRQGSATNLPCLKENFTHVVSQDALYLVLDKPRSHAEVHRVLRPGGIFAFCDFLQPTKKISKRTRALVFDRLRFHDGYSVEEYQRALEKAGFDILESRDLHSHFLKTYLALAKKARTRAQEIPDASARSLMLHYCASCIEIYNTIERRELGWGLFVARKSA